MQLGGPELVVNESLTQIFPLQAAYTLAALTHMTVTPAISLVFQLIRFMVAGILVAVVVFVVFSCALRYRALSRTCVTSSRPPPKATIGKDGKKKGRRKQEQHRYPVGFRVAHNSGNLDEEL